MLSFAEKRLTSQDKKEFKQKILMHLAGYVKLMLRKFGKFSEDATKYYDDFTYEEINLKACIRREINELKESGKISHSETEEKEENLPENWKKSIMGKDYNRLKKQSQLKK